MTTRRFDIKFFDGFTSTLKSYEVNATSSDDAHEKFKKWAEEFCPSADFDGMVEIPPGCE